MPHGSDPAEVLRAAGVRTVTYSQLREAADPISRGIAVIWGDVDAQEPGEPLGAMLLRLDQQPFLLVIADDVPPPARTDVLGMAARALEIAPDPFWAVVEPDREITYIVWRGRIA